MQQEFGGIKRVLVLEAESIVTSDDPLEQFLERKGWQLSRIRQLRKSIEMSLIPNVFTGKTDPLTRAEKELQRDIDEYYERRRGSGRADG